MGAIEADPPIGSHAPNPAGHSSQGLGSHLEHAEAELLQELGPNSYLICEGLGRVLEP